tara:strand:+ start:3168 stop:4229 length:1062 start_codon:yes stop_codon:yes gene_type:complete
MYYFRFLYIFFFVIALNIFFFSTKNLIAKSFIINDIKISEPFEENFDKNNIIDAGFENAFFQLMDLLIRSDDLEKVESVKLNEIKSMIQSFTIKEEKFVNNYYFLNLGVIFEKKKIYDYLEKRNIFPSQIKREKFLFLPVVINENNNEIFVYENNLVYKKWNSNTKNINLLNYILPSEDLDDLNIIKSKIDNIENYNFEEIIKKYFLDYSIIALIFKEKNEIKVLSKINLKNNEIIINNSFQNYLLNDESEVMDFINKLKIVYEDLWKVQNQINTSIKLPLIIEIENKNFKTSSNFEDILKEIDLISDYSIKSFDKNFIYYEVIFNGTPQNFIKTMGENNYEFDTQKKIWSLK